MLGRYMAGDMLSEDARDLRGDLLPSLAPLADCYAMRLDNRPNAGG